MKEYRDKIFLTYDDEYIYQDQAWMLDDDEYDHRSFTIINPGPQDRKHQLAVKPMRKERKQRM